MKKISNIERNHNFDEILFKLKKDGFSIIDSIKILKKSYGLSLQEAKEIVDKSPVWQEIVKHSSGLIDNFLDNCDKKSINDV